MIGATEALKPSAPLVCHSMSYAPALERMARVAS